MSALSTLVNGRSNGCPSGGDVDTIIKRRGVSTESIEMNREITIGKSDETVVFPILIAAFFVLINLSVRDANHANIGRS
jgi:hypothetical protein